MITPQRTPKELHRELLKDLGLLQEVQRELHKEVSFLQSK